ncbi:MAG: phosphate acyltransferase PlsX [Anaerolineales bacterium]|nr:MAG: phosphate acyltransferase PlsX [Anaerolineales bacterium]
MRIVLDAMGGDYAPEVVVEGGVMAAREYGIEVVLVGPQEVVDAELAKHDTTGLSLPVVHASQVIEMTDEPSMSARKKKDSSMVVGMNLVKNGEADAFTTAGNSGGALAAALFRLGRIKGIKRPALSTVFPTQKGLCFICDVGANTDCRPVYLLQFGIMASAYAERVLGIPNPRVGIVSNGEEEGKGNILVKEAFRLLKKSDLNFIGNLEGKDIPAGLADVVVTDGFSGNIVIKLSEGVASLLMRVMEEEIKKSPMAVLGALLARSALREVKSRLDYSEYAGAPLLGVDGVVIVGHGRSNAKAIKNMVRVGKESVEKGMLEALKEGIAGSV